MSILSNVIHRTIRSITVAMLLAGCGKFTERPTSTPTDYVWLTRYDVKTLDPAALQDWTSGKVLSYLYPSIGALCEIGCDKPSVFSLTVKPRKFTNGDPVKAEDIRFTLERCLVTEIHSSVGNQFAAQIRGSKAFSDGKAAHLEGIKITDDFHLSIILDHIDSTYIEKLNNSAFGVLNHVRVNLSKPLTDALPGYGAGNWTMESMSPGTEWTLRSKISGESLKFRFSGDSATRRNLYDAGGADYAMFAAHEVGVVKGHKDLTKGGPTTLVYLQFNPKTKPALTPEFRGHIAAVIHANVNFAKLLGDHVVPAKSFLDCSGPGFLLPNPPPDRKIVSKEHFEITFAEIGMQNPSVEGIVSALRRDGMDIQGRAMPSGAMLESNSKGEIPILFTGWQPDFDGPLNTIPMLFHSKSSENHSGFNNPEVDRHINFAQQGGIVKESIELVAAIVQSEVPCIPLYVQRDLVLMRREPPKP
jgi:ABC-type oligopeptide transport system substrate-binding subunit